MTDSTLITPIIIAVFSCLIFMIKQAIKNEYDEKLENLKLTLQLTKIEYQISDSKLHEERANVIAETYALLTVLYRNLSDYVKPFVPAGNKSTEERRKIVIAAYNVFLEYYPKKQIFIPKKLMKLLTT